MFAGTVVATLLTWFFQDSYTEAAYVFIALMALVGIVWVLSEREMTFHHMGSMHPES
jgi:predicted nucleic-acid-binding protein